MVTRKTASSSAPGSPPTTPPGRAASSPSIWTRATPSAGCASPAATTTWWWPPRRAWAIRFHETEDIRELGRTARGVRAMQPGGRRLHCGHVHPAGGRPGAHRDGDRLWPPLRPAENYRSAEAGRQGPAETTTPSEFGDVAAIKVVDMDDDIILISEDGVIIRIAASSVRVCARPSKGVRVMKLPRGQQGGHPGPCAPRGGRGGQPGD